VEDDDGWDEEDEAGRIVSSTEYSSSSSIKTSWKIYFFIYYIMYAQCFFFHFWMGSLLFFLNPTKVKIIIKNIFSTFFKDFLDLLT